MNNDTILDGDFNNPFLSIASVTINKIRNLPHEESSNALILYMFRHHTLMSDPNKLNIRYCKGEMK